MRIGDLAPYLSDYDLIPQGNALKQARQRAPDEKATWMCQSDLYRSTTWYKVVDWTQPLKDGYLTDE